MEPLETILEEGEKGSLTADKTITAAKPALRFIGNASVQMSRERRKRAITEMNDKLIELLEKAKKHSVTVETDASLMGWGAVCWGTRMGGPWSREEQSLHNCL